MPKRYQLPFEMLEAILLVETGWTPTELENSSETLIQNVLAYKAIKEVSQHGGNIQF
jgi:hypothetical protein